MGHFKFTGTHTSSRYTLPEYSTTVCRFPWVTLGILVHACCRYMLPEFYVPEHIYGSPKGTHSYILPKYIILQYHSVHRLTMDHPRYIHAVGTHSTKVYTGYIKGNPMIHTCCRYTPQVRVHTCSKYTQPEFISEYPWIHTCSSSYAHSWSIYIT